MPNNCRYLQSVSAQKHLQKDTQDERHGYETCRNDVGQCLWSLFFSKYLLMLILKVKSVIAVPQAAQNCKIMIILKHRSGWATAFLYEISTYN